jgi:CheY-like chemotaxis protein
LANEQTELEEAEAARLAGAHTVTMSSDRARSLLSSANTVEEEEDTTSNNQDEKSLFSMALLDGDGKSDIETGNNPLLTSNPDETIMVLSITVADTGIGIPTDRLKNIFEPYTQAKLSDFRQHGGTGLGLSIISSLIKAMDGTISVTSKGGEGSKFHLKIPVRVPHHSTLDGNDGEVDANDSIGFGGNAKVGSDSTFLECQRMPVYEDANKNPSASHRKTLSSGATWDTEAQLSKIAEAGGPLFDTSQNGNSCPPQDLISLSEATESSPPRTKLSLSPKRGVSNGEGPSPALPPFDFAPKSNLVLVVDDNSVNRKILGKMLTTYKLEYETACNGKEAVDILLQSRNATGDMSRPNFGLVFMDVSMPVMDGNVAIKTIRKAKISVPVVALSANVLSQERDRTICLGADEFHTKPILRQDLHMLCTRFLYKNGQQPQKPMQMEQEHRSSSPLSTDLDTSSGSEGYNRTFTVRRWISLVDCIFPVRNGVFPYQTGKIRVYFPCQDQYFPYETGKIPVFSRLARVFQLAGVFSLLVSYCFSIVICTNTFWQLFYNRKQQRR